MAAGAFSVAAAGASAAPPRWMVTDLGTLGGPGSTAAAINEQGQVVGKSNMPRQHNGFTPDRAFLWQHGKMLDLGTLGGSSSEATALNEHGQVVGTSDTAKTRDGQPLRHAFLWEDGKMRDLGTLGGRDSEAIAINNDGDVIGESDTGRQSAGFAVRHAFLWQNGMMRDLGTLGGTDSRAVAMTNSGQILGLSDTLTDPSTDEGFLWENGHLTDIGLYFPQAINARGQVLGIDTIWDNGTIVPLAPAAGDIPGVALDLNANGDAAGYCIRELPAKHTQVARPCLWQNRTGRELGVLGYGDRGRALALNDRTQVVGRTGIGPPSGKNHAFLWQDGILTDLGGLRRSDWSEAIDITNTGIILGNSSATRISAEHAVIWTLRRTQ